MKYFLGVFLRVLRHQEALQQQPLQSITILLWLIDKYWRIIRIELNEYLM